MLNQDLFNTFTLKNQTWERIYLTMGMILMHQGLVIHHHSYQTRILNLEFEITIYYLCLTIKAPSLTRVSVVPCIPRILFKKCTVNTLHCLHVVSAWTSWRNVCHWIKIRYRDCRPIFRNKARVICGEMQGKSE